jgi:hypothetical protein
MIKFGGKGKSPAIIESIWKLLVIWGRFVGGGTLAEFLRVGNGSLGRF